MANTITISPITRLEGHGKIEIFLDDRGQVRDSYFQVVELRGFEKFCQGRPVEELPRIMPKICGVCPGAHHMASVKATDMVYQVAIPPAAEKLRRLYYNAHIAHSHMLHFFALGAPDFIMGPDADAANRNILGLVDVMGKDLVKEVLQHRGYAQRIQQIIAGHPIHPVVAVPGGMAKGITAQERDELIAMGKSLVEFAGKSLQIWQQKILHNARNRDLLTSDHYYHETYYLGLVNDDEQVDFYDGKIKIIDPLGKPFASFAPQDYLKHIAERVETWTYLKFPYLKNVGWHGFVDGVKSGIYRVNSLARLNVAKGMATPQAQKAYQQLYDFFGQKPVHNTLAFHWARLVETLFAVEELTRIAEDEDIVGQEMRNIPSNKPTEGVGVVEAPRGTLFHHYTTDRDGMVKSVNLIVATVQNNSAMNMSVKKAATKLFASGAKDEKILNMVEMAFRAYDPCLACASHCLPGKMPLQIRVYQDNELTRIIKRS